MKFEEFLSWLSYHSKIWSIELEVDYEEVIKEFIILMFKIDRRLRKKKTFFISLEELKKSGIEIEYIRDCEGIIVEEFVEHQNKGGINEDNFNLKDPNN